MEDLLKLKGKTPEEQEMIQAATELIRQESLQQSQEKIAINLLRKGMDLEVVVEVTDLSRSAVQRLQREIDEA